MNMLVCIHKTSSLAYKAEKVGRMTVKYSSKNMSRLEYEAAAKISHRTKDYLGWKLSTIVSDFVRTSNVYAADILRDSS